MFTTKILRGKSAHRILKKIPFKTEHDQLKIRTTSVKNVSRYLATHTAAASEHNVLTSLYGVVEDEDISLTDFIIKDFELWPDKPALTCGVSGRSYQYGMMKMMIERCAKALISHLKLTPGDRVGMILPNIPEFVVVIHGAMKAGLVVTFTNPLNTVDEVRRQFSECNVKSIATIEMFMPVAMEVSKSLKDYKGTIFVGGDDDKVRGIHGLNSLLSAGHETSLPKVDANDVCLIPYSSGTSGLPKGVMLTHRNLVANVKQLENPEFMKYKGARGTGSVTFTIPTFFHIYGFNSVLNYNIDIGNHLISIPKFTPEDYLQTLVKYRPSNLFLVPSLLIFLAGHPAVKKEHLQSVDSITVGGAPVTENIMEKFLLKAGKTKDEIVLLQGYGMTETSPVTLVTPYFYPHDKVGTIGQIVPSTQMKVVSLTTGEALGPNESGEIYVKGPQVMKGYLNNEAATKEIINDEGWLQTGDVAYYDEEQYFYIVDRTKELIKVKGNQVSPTEIETLIMEQPEVADVAVIGIPDAKAGELPKAFVVLKQNHRLTEKQVYEYVAKKLIKYKHLEGGIEFIDEIPRNVGGKIMRNQLKTLNSSK